MIRCARVLFGRLCVCHSPNDEVGDHGSGRTYPAPAALSRFTNSIMCAMPRRCGMPVWLRGRWKGRLECRTILKNRAKVRARLRMRSQRCSGSPQRAHELTRTSRFATLPDRAAVPHFDVPLWDFRFTLPARGS